MLRICYQCSLSTPLLLHSTHEYETLMFALFSLTHFAQHDTHQFLSTILIPSHETNFIISYCLGIPIMFKYHVSNLI